VVHGVYQSVRRGISHRLFRRPGGAKARRQIDYKGLKMKKLILLICTVALSWAQQGEKPPAPVTTAKVKKGTVNPLETFIGTVSHAQSSELAAEVSGKVAAVYFQAGDRVQKGEVLLRLDTSLLDARIAGAQAALQAAKSEYENAKKDLKRYESLIAQNSIAQKVYDDSRFRYLGAQAAVEQAKANLEQLRVQREKTAIKAPCEGIAASKNSEVGQWLGAGSTVTSLVGSGGINLLFYLPGDYVHKLDASQVYDIQLAGKEIKARLYAKLPKGDKKTRTFPVKFTAELGETFVYEGMEARVRLPRERELQALIVPRDAVIKRFNQRVVFVNNGGSAQMLPVRIVGYSGTDVAVEGQGLQEGMEVVTKGNERIFPKQPIQAIR
jgi:RND family efflux transporter MFP subunit